MAIGTKKQIKKGKAWSLLTRKRGSDTVNLMEKGVWSRNVLKIKSYLTGIGDKAVFCVRSMKKEGTCFESFVH